ELATGRVSDLIGALVVLVETHPRRERLRGALMLALARAGRSAEALEVYSRGWSLTVEEAGLEPGPALRALYVAILRGEIGRPAAVPRQWSGVPVRWRAWEPVGAGAGTVGI